jgi:hypothetical protein
MYCSHKRKFIEIEENEEENEKYVFYNEKKQKNHHSLIKIYDIYILAFNKDLFVYDN